MAETQDRQLSTLEKALEINLDTGRYGTFAEIGAGQEVVRWFFQAGGAAGTISKSISAYDMQVSDAIYGSCDRYVSRQRLEAMLEHEQKLNRDGTASRTCTAWSRGIPADSSSDRPTSGSRRKSSCSTDAWNTMRKSRAPASSGPSSPDGGAVQRGG